MNCDDYRQGHARGEHVEGHLDGCEPCRILTQLLDVPEEIEPFNLQPIPRRSGPVIWLQSLPTTIRISSILIVIAGIVTAVALLKGRIDWSLYPGLRLCIEIAALSVLVVAAVTISFRPLYLPPIRTAVERSLWAFALLVPFVIALAPVAHTAHPESMAGLGDDLIPRALGCFKFGSAYALGIVAMLLVLSRNSRWTGRIIGMVSAGGAVGVLALQVHCPLTGNSHLLWGHATVSFALIALGVLFSTIFTFHTSKSNTPG